MDLDGVKSLREPIVYPDEDSGSAYETGSENDHGASHDEQAAVTRSSRASSVKSRGKRGGRKNSHTAVKFGDSELSDAGGGRRVALDRASIAPSMDDQVFEDAVEWASNFQAPESPGEIKDPRRRVSGNRKKRRAQKPANEIRVKRLKPYYNNGYRQLLNIDIEDTAIGRVREDNIPLQPSQIGSSIWTSAEKDLFFTALMRLGRDNVRGIASRIMSKSELEVQEYIQLLNHGINEKRLHENRLLAPIDMPAAIHISDECSGVLERAGDALAIRQELSEEKVEQTKWGDSWLLTKEVSRRIETRRKEDGGQEAMDEVLPAATLFNFGNWLELSDRLFMNSGAPFEEDNWQNLAEPGESPAVRATAFEDFHSLAVSVTKRLISTTLFCTMSKIRARNSNKIKHADISSGDVEAAVNILGMKSNSNDFWIGCARRCHLKVVNDGTELEEEKDEHMPYDEVETALRYEDFSRSGSSGHPIRPSSRSSYHSDPPTSSQLDLEPDSPSSESSVLDYPTSALEHSDSDSSSLSSTSSTHFSSRRLESKLKKRAARKTAERAQDAYTEAFDMQASKLEEARLWELLKQDPPFEAGKVEPVEKLEVGKGKCAGGETGNWREWVRYWSPWETLETPVLEGEFQRNRRTISKKARRREASNLRAERLSSSGRSSDNESGQSQHEFEESEVENIEPAEGRADTEDEPHDETEDVDLDDSGNSSR
jgi:RNA polymerase I-specific transcription initiation factor RRN5